MNELATRDLGRGELAQFEPSATKTRNAKVDAVIRYAQRLKDWPLLEQAVDSKLEQQEEFVGWWREKVRPNKGGDRKKGEKRGSALFVVEAEKATGITQQQVSKWAKRLAKREEYRASLYGSTYRKAMGELLNNFRAQTSGKQEWYTPAEYIELARAAMGAIDLDPASSDEAQKTVKAAEYFTRARNGLAQPWHGRVFLNPPYAQPEIGQFVEKLMSEVEAQRVEQAVLLVNNCTDTGWFHRAAVKCAALCLTAGRISYVDPSGAIVGSPTQGQAFLYFGVSVGSFTAQFAAIGLLLRPL